MDRPPASPPRRCSSYAEGVTRDTVVEALLELSPHPSRSPARSCSTPLQGARARLTLSPLIGTPGVSSPFSKFMGDYDHSTFGDTPSKWCHSLHGSPFTTSGSRNAKAAAQGSPRAALPMFPHLSPQRKEDKSAEADASMKWGSPSTSSSKKSRPRTLADASPMRAGRNPAKRLCFDDAPNVTPVARVEESLRSTEDPSRLFRVFRSERLDRRRSHTDPEAHRGPANGILHDNLDFHPEGDSLITPATVGKIERSSTFGAPSTIFSPESLRASPPSAQSTAKSAFSPNSITRIGPNGAKQRTKASPGSRSSVGSGRSSRRRDGGYETAQPERAKEGPRAKSSFERTTEQMFGLGESADSSGTAYGAASGKYGVQHNMFVSPLAASRLQSSVVHITPSTRGECKSETSARTTSGKNSKKGRGMMCNCKKSRCLKMYCECFAHQVYCSLKCNCNDCHNVVEKESKRRAAIKSTLDRNPQAFNAKINREGKSHSLGCHCKKSQCLKKYCECFQGGIVCTDKCKCDNCLNFPGSDEMITRRLRLKLPPAQIPVKAEKAVEEVEAHLAVHGDVQDMRLGAKAEAGEVVLGLVKRPPKIMRVTQGNSGGRTGVISPFGPNRDAGCVEWLDFCHPHAEAERSDFLDGITPLTYTITAARGLPRGPTGLCTPTPPRRRRSTKEISDSILSLRKAEKGRFAKYPIFGPGMAHVTKATVFQVFMYLDNDDLYNACLVCRFWENLALDDHLWDQVEPTASQEKLESPKPSAKKHSAKRDSGRKDSVKRESSKKESARRGSAKKDTAKGNKS